MNDTKADDDQDAQHAEPASGDDHTNEGDRVSLEEVEAVSLEGAESEDGTPAPPKPPPKGKASTSTGPDRPLPPPASAKIAGGGAHPSELPPRRFPPRTVADIMTRKVFVVAPGDSLENIEESMDRFRFRHLPVVDDQRRLVGLVSHRDILRASASSLSEMSDKRNEFIRKNAKVGSLMHREPTTVAADADVRKSAMVMRGQRIGCLPVVDADDRVIGIVTEADYVSLAIELLNPERRRKK